MPGSQAIRVEADKVFMGVVVNWTCTPLLEACIHVTCISGCSSAILFRMKLATSAGLIIGSSTSMST